MDERLTASTTVAELLRRCPMAARILVSRRMHCVGCAIAPFETLADACEIYGVSLHDLLAELKATTVERANAEIFPTSHDPR